jgi:hypothetical protein
LLAFEHLENIQHSQNFQHLEENFASVGYSPQAFKHLENIQHSQNFQHLEKKLLAKMALGDVQVFAQVI